MRMIFLSKQTIAKNNPCCLLRAWSQSKLDIAQGFKGKSDAVVHFSITGVPSSQIKMHHINYAGEIVLSLDNLCT